MQLANDLIDLLIVLFRGIFSNKFICNNGSSFREQSLNKCDKIFTNFSFINGKRLWNFQLEFHDDRTTIIANFHVWNWIE